MQPTRTGSCSVDTACGALGSIHSLHSSSAADSFSLLKGQTHCEACRVQILTLTRTATANVTLDITLFTSCELPCC